MRRTSSNYSALVSSALLAAVGLAGCSRSEQATTPVAESQTQHPVQPLNQPLTVSGCLRSGDASETFVLMTSAASGPAGDSTASATYQLAGASGVNLRDHVGRRIEVEGVLRAQQQSESRAAGPAANAPTGTAGSPRVETTTEVDIKHLDVSSVKPLADDCDR